MESASGAGPRRPCFRIYDRMIALPWILERTGMRSAFRAYISQRRYGSIRKYVGCDAHARYSIFVSMDEGGKLSAPVRVEHEELEMRQFARRFAGGLRDVGQLVLAGAGHGGSRARSATGPCAGGEEVPARPQQDRRL